MHADNEPSDTVSGSASPPDEQIAYNVPHAAKIIDLSERQMWTLVRDGAIESIKIGTSRRITRSALVAYIERHRGAA